MKKLFILSTLFLSQFAMADKWQCTATCVHFYQPRYTELAIKIMQTNLGSEKETPLAALYDMNQECKEITKKAGFDNSFVALIIDVNGASAFNFANPSNACVRVK